jgi:uncharacterized RDD family membrane protein YckC
VQRPPGRLVTPEAVVLQLQHAGPATRILARGLDALIQGFILLALTLALAASTSAGGVVVVVVYLFGVVLVIFGYPAFSEFAWRGRTLGKAAFGLRVLTRDGAPIRFRHAAIRSVLFVVDGIVFGPVVGILALVISADTVRLGDLAAGTIVVRERSGARSPGPVAFAVPPGCEAFAASLDTSGLTTLEYGLIRSFLTRVEELDVASRHSLAVQIAAPLANRSYHRIPPWMGPELYLRCVAAAVQWRSSLPAPTQTYVASRAGHGTSAPRPGRERQGPLINTNGPAQSWGHQELPDATEQGPRTPEPLGGVSPSGERAPFVPPT